jgi:hypothetical protein
MERTTHGIQLSIKLIPPIIGLFISNWYEFQRRRAPLKLTKINTIGDCA